MTMTLTSSEVQTLVDIAADAARKLGEAGAGGIVILFSVSTESGHADYNAVMGDPYAALGLASKYVNTNGGMDEYVEIEFEEEGEEDDEEGETWKGVPG